jgi:hypothetical protein
MKIGFIKSVILSAISLVVSYAALGQSAPTLSLSAASTHGPVVHGTSATDVFTVTTGGSFAGNVNFTVAGLPSGVTGSWSSNPITPVSGTGSSTLKLAASTAATVNWFTFTVTAAGDGLSVTWTYTVEIEQAPGMTMQVSNTALSMTSLGSTTETVTATPFGGAAAHSGASGATAAIVSGLPSGVTASWSSPTVNGAGAVNWTLTLSGSPTAIGSSSALVLSEAIPDASNGKTYSGSQGPALSVAFVSPDAQLFACLNPYSRCARRGRNRRIHGSDRWVFPRQRYLYRRRAAQRCDRIMERQSNHAGLRQRLRNAYSFGDHHSGGELVHLHRNRCRRWPERDLDLHGRGRTGAWDDDAGVEHRIVNDFVGINH